MTPQLMTRQRGRPQLVKSTAEIEAEELEKIQKYVHQSCSLIERLISREHGRVSEVLLKD